MDDLPSKVASCGLLLIVLALEPAMVNPFGDGRTADASVAACLGLLFLLLLGTGLVMLSVWLRDSQDPTDNPLLSDADRRTVGPSD
ncbi:hypothetical protein B296_00017472 [Ensete ventricosum]|uniref:Uncharacterized protein n=1 Tax=Ensete ventricosum TaxID=4639 RepID=A0A426ZAX9_ENSVE|nr:hypothetical protein B296_00017472 [Ensete ventricosum]